MNPGGEVGIQVLAGDDFNGENLFFREGLLEEQVVHQVIDAYFCHPFGILINQKINRSFFQIAEVFFQ